MKESLGWNADGSITTIEVDNDDLKIKTEMNVQPILDNNARLRTMPQHKRNGYLAGSVDAVTYREWKREWREKHPGAPEKEWSVYLLGKLKDRDYSKFRTTDMKI